MISDTPYDEDIHDQPPASPIPLNKYLNPLGATAAGLLKLEKLPEAEQRAIEHELVIYTQQVRQFNFTEIEKLLIYQIHLMHRLCTDSIAKYADGGMTEKVRMHATTAVKSQNCCRMNMATLQNIKSFSALAAKNNFDKIVKRTIKNTPL